MKGIEALVHTLVAGGVDTCFANPGTSEMPFVAAVDEVPELNCVLCLTEGVVAGAADGYGRMTDKPAATLLHLGVGTSNAQSNLHNARKANSPMINLVGQNATRHLRHESVLDADIDHSLGAYSDWMRTIRHPLDIADDTALAIQEAQRAPGRVTSLVIQADAGWGECPGVGKIQPVPAAPHPAPSLIEQAADRLRQGNKTVMIIDGRALRTAGLQAASRIAQHTGARIYTPYLYARLERGAGRPAFPEFPIGVAQAQQALEGVETLILVGARMPTGTFSYPNLPSSPVGDHMEVIRLARPEEDVLAGLQALVRALGADAVTPAATPVGLPALPAGEDKLTPPAIASTLANVLPPNAIICDEAGLATDIRAATAGCAPHDYLRITGGAIGVTVPLGLGAAVACPDRPVVVLTGDGSAMYHLQALWSMAREQTNVTVLVYDNRQYKVLLNELTRMGIQAPKGNARKLLDLTEPALDWLALSQGMGVTALRATTNTELLQALKTAFSLPGPKLIDMVL